METENPTRTRTHPSGLAPEQRIPAQEIARHTTANVDPLKNSLSKARLLGDVSPHVLPVTLAAELIRFLASPYSAVIDLAGSTSARSDSV